MSEHSAEFPSQVSYLCVEGVIGAGKTSLCNLLAQQCNARLVLEEAEENPFLQKFYRNRRAYAFQAQLWFLVSRYKQLSVMVAQQDLFHELTISDYMFAKDRIFANINLEEHELTLYNNIARVMEVSIPRPDLVVYLQASTSVIMRRIEKRGRPYEFNMDPGYIEFLNEAYNHFFFHYTTSPLLIINTNDIDFVNETADLEEIVRQITTTRSGTNYYRPISSKKSASAADLRSPRK
jgi:deoxyguanosine kinase